MRKVKMKWRVITSQVDIDSEWLQVRRKIRATENDSQQMTTGLNLIEEYQQITKQQNNEISLY